MKIASTAILCSAGRSRSENGFRSCCRSNSNQCMLTHISFNCLLCSLVIFSSERLFSFIGRVLLTTGGVVPTSGG